MKRAMTEYRIKVFGERNTGTRAALTMLRGVPDVLIGGGPALDPETRQTNADLREAIEQQFRAPWRLLYLDAMVDMECVARGPMGAWKHSRPIFDPGFARDNVRVLFMVRDPYSWALSLFRKPYHRKGPRADTLDGFLDQPWMTERRDYLPCVLKSPMVLWNEKLRATLDFCAAAEGQGVRTHLLRFEDFIADPVATLSTALDAFEVPAKNVKPVENSTKNESQQLPALQKYYRDELWRSRICQDAATRINALVDWDLAAKFGYNTRMVSDFPDTAERVDPQGVPRGMRIDPNQSSLAHAVRKRMKSAARSFGSIRLRHAQD